MKNALECGRYLREFFAFEEKFRFVNCKCLKHMKALSASAHFSFTVYFSQSIPPGKNIKSENFKLYVSPVVNLFEHQAEPIILDHRHFEYRIIPSIRDTFDVFAVTNVRGINKATGEEKNYLKFNEFRHLINEKGDKAGGNYYSMRREYMVGNEFKTYLSLGSHGPVEDYKEEYISISLLCTNSSLPRKEIKEGDICNPVSDFPDFIRFSNLTRPTTPLFPPHKKLFLWTLLSHINMNFKTLCSRETLKEVLSLYDWKQSGTNRKLIQGVLGVSAAKKDFMMGGQLIHGTEITVTFKDGTFNEAGEQNIFGKILLTFLSQYASINYLVALRFISEPSGLTYTWDPEHGKCHLI
jgi:type VI secretion system protein ImpG